MNLEFFIAKRLIKGAAHKISISATIIKIAIVAIALSIIMMLIAIATGVGLKNKIREKITAFNGHIQIHNYDNNVSDISVEPVSIHQDFYPKFKTIDGIAHVQAVATKGGVIRTEDTFEGVIAKGVGPDYNWNALGEFLQEGRLPNYKENLNNEVLLSTKIANRLQLKVNDSFNIFFPKEDNSTPNQRKFTIVGLFNSSFEEFDGTYFFTDIRHIQRMNKWKADEIGNFEVFLTDFNTIEEKSKEIYGETVSSLDTQNIKTKFYELFEWMDLFNFNIAIIIGIMIIVGGINMITALLVLILERTQMIGILKAMGANNWLVRKVFLYNAAYLIGVGLFWGNVIGIGILVIQQQFKVFKFPNPEQYYVEHIPVYLDIPSIIFLNVGVLLLCLLMLLVPSLIISKISPVKAIRFE